MKFALRRRLKARLADMTPEAIAAKSRQACALLVGLEEFQRAAVVLVYLPIRGEVDATPATRAALEAGKTVLAPKVSFERCEMLGVVIRSLADDLFATRHGLREPASQEAWPVGEIDLVVVPALAYDRQGNRLGRGGGIYDRFLARPELRAVTCGLAFADQVVAEVPTHPNDRPVDMLVTDEEVLRFTPRRRRAAQQRIVP